MYVQVALLMTWYSDGHEEIVANAWHWIGFAIRIAIGHGMHRDATHSKMLPVHRRLWTRLWWILFQFDTAHAKLCAIFASAMRSRWALRSSTHDRVAASRRADDALAAFLVQLPPALKPSAATRGLAAPSWSATLHLTYNNFVLLLHRPPPVAGTDAVSAACADPALCAGATASMAAILEALCCDDGDGAGGAGGGGDDALWLYGVHAAFTALIYVSNELAAPNPMVAARARGLFDTLMDALRRLARYWQFAESLLRLFRQKEASLLKDGGATATAAEAAAAAGEPRLSAAERFSLRPAPLAQMPWEDAMGGGGHAAPQRFENEYSAASGLAGEATQQQQQQQHGGELHVDELMAEGYPDSFALELFLAGMDGSTQDCV
ncbi:Acetamidase regulatory protein [Beauveria bassiana]|uniref:Acetamidase regulatory protein n=1 Tax=Beauveria bassiana TaxID=176275 RepID=A0A2N6NKS8_BEABA|nr:Acetamidase regulatory protein [Beauveria bassiana]